MKIGFIQVQGIGDILIALPIARWLMRQGHEILWPINSDFIPFYALAAPDIAFMPLSAQDYPDYKDFHYYAPLKLLQEAGCERIHILFNYLADFDHPGGKLAELLPLDTYKYSVTGCPLSEKWTLQLARDMGREKALFHSLNLTRPYIVVHSRGLETVLIPTLPPHWAEQYQIVHISAVTDNPFDWIYTLERAAKLVILESMYSNLIEQLNLTGEKYLLIHSPATWTPVYKNDWVFCVALQPITERSPP